MYNKIDPRITIDVREKMDKDKDNHQQIGLSKTKQLVAIILSHFHNVFFWGLALKRTVRVVC